jgi:hypothetical protein
MTSTTPKMKEVLTKLGMRAVEAKVKGDGRPFVLGLFATHRDWERTAAAVEDALRAKIAADGAALFHDTYGSPLHFEPDFVISCSRWSIRFVDPLDTVPKFVLHPLLPPLTRDIDGTSPLAPVDVAMINPLPQKGSAHMAHVIRHNERQWTFRVLQGGWGDAFAAFAPLVREVLQACDGRVAMVPYVRDMAAFYRSTRTFIQPSRLEGYGMAAVEAMQAGTPVITTDYPAIREAVGDAARIVPYDAEGGAWIEAIAEVLGHPGAWREKAQARIEALRGREAEELTDFIRFLEQMERSTRTTDQAGV